MSQELNPEQVHTVMEKLKKDMADSQATQALLKEECEKRGLPVSLEVLLRHIENNHAATVGAYQAAIKRYETTIDGYHKEIKALLDDID